MSKSLGNTVEPWEVIDRYGADALRWYFFTSKQPVGRLPLLAGHDRRGGPPVPAPAVEHLRLLRPVRQRQRRRRCTDAGRRAEPTDLDRWVLSRLQETVEIVRDRLDDFDATTAGRAIQAFVDELSNWYVRRSRRRFWDGDPAAFATLRECLVTVAKLLAPFTPVHRRRDLRQPRRRRAERAPVRLPRAPASATAELEQAMAVARETVRLGLAARAPGQDQGPPAAARRGDRRHRPRARRRSSGSAEIVREELNVRELRFVSEADELGEVEIKPNYRTLGPAVRQADAARGGRRRRRWTPATRRRRCATAAGVDHGRRARARARTPTICWSP